MRLVGKSPHCSLKTIQGPFMKKKELHLFQPLDRNIRIVCMALLSHQKREPKEQFLFFFFFFKRNQWHFLFFFFSWSRGIVRWTAAVSGGAPVAADGAPRAPRPPARRPLGQQILRRHLVPERLLATVTTHKNWLHATILYRAAEEFVSDPSGPKLLQLDTGLLRMNSVLTSLRETQ